MVKAHTTSNKDPHVDMAHHGSANAPAQTAASDSGITELSLHKRGPTLITGLHAEY